MLLYKWLLYKWLDSIVNVLTQSFPFLHIALEALHYIHLFIIAQMNLMINNFYCNDRQQKTIIPYTHEAKHLMVLYCMLQIGCHVEMVNDYIHYVTNCWDMQGDIWLVMENNGIITPG